MNLKIYHLIGEIFTIFLGSTLHFTYKLSGYNKIVATFSSVNESTWEHLKLLFYPILVFGIVEYISYGKYINNFISIKFISIILGMITIIISFYTYTGIIGKNFLILDIGTFILGVTLSFFFSYKFLNKNYVSYDYLTKQCLVGILALLLCFIFFTFCPPKIKLFKDPITNSYGI